MYLHIGGNVELVYSDIIGIFDLDKTTVTERGKEFLNRAQQNDRIIETSIELPLSFAVTIDNSVYLSSVGTQVLSKR